LVVWKKLVNKIIEKDTILVNVLRKFLIK
jgi:hypothetical protein